MKFGIHSEQYANKSPRAEIQKVNQIFGELTLKFGEKLKVQVAASDIQVQELVK